MKDIERVVDRIDVNHASATFQIDRDYVMEKVNSTIGTVALNSFCKEIVRRALISVGALVEENSREEQWRKIFTDLRERAKSNTMDVPQKIEIQRAVALMQRRIYTHECAEHASATELLKDTAIMAKRFYGPQSEILADILAIV